MLYGILVSYWTFREIEVLSDMSESIFTYKTISQLSRDYYLHWFRFLYFTEDHFFQLVFQGGHELIPFPQHYELSITRQDLWWTSGNMYLCVVSGGKDLKNPFFCVFLCCERPHMPDYWLGHMDKFPCICSSFYTGNIAKMLS